VRYGDSQQTPLEEREGSLFIRLLWRRLIFLSYRGSYGRDGGFFFFGGYSGFPYVLTLVVFREPVFYTEAALTELAFEWEMYFLAAE
jgi:hypothetical protein